MNKIKHNPMNKLPVITYRWLKLNDITLDIPFENNIIPYNKEYLKYNRNDTTRDNRIIIDKMNPSVLATYDSKARENDASLQTYKTSEYGVSKELVAECENSYNSGLFIELPEAITIDEPIRVEYSLDKSNPSVVDYNIIYAGAASKATIVIDYATEDQTESYHNGAMKIYAKEGSDITIVKIQRMNDMSHHFDSHIAYVSPYARAKFIQIELGSKHSVTNYIGSIKESGEATISSIYFGDGTRLIDLSYHMKHIGRRSISNIQTKGALKDYAVKTFRGTIDFEKGASQSDGSEEEYVILLDKNVTSNAIPLLLCSEDDVKGQHAASAGKVDSDKLFYMMSRGFTREEAMKMIVEASFQPIIEHIPFADLRQLISDDIHGRIINEKL
ncbi:MAG: Fe-S cluster assembly protein SufD [Clostridiales bacterium]|jgi:FeS assembly protein SufD|nr:Fe-S cluster assembly protein SufD [Clostridiales bacterium]